MILLDVNFQLTESNYRAPESSNMNVVVAKNIRLANPVTLLVTPYTISEAEGINEIDPVDLPPGFSSAQRTFAVLYFLLVFV